jgi:hypothetical protein
MPYEAEISRFNPAGFLFLLDQSQSMRGAMAGTTRSKAEAVADVLNRLLQDLCIRCAKADGIRDYFHVAVLGYGATVGSAFSGGLAGQGLVPVSAVANTPLRIEERTRLVEDGAGGLVEQKFKFPVWIQPAAGGNTPMAAALRQASMLVQDFLIRYPNSFPPVVLNITDGRPTDEDPRPVADELRRLSSTDGEALLFNAHLSPRAEPPVAFPSAESGLADNYARLLFRMSSPLPAPFLQDELFAGLPPGARPRGFLFNADMVSIIRFMNIGTRPGARAR